MPSRHSYVAVWALPIGQMTETSAPAAVSARASCQNAPIEGNRQVLDDDQDLASASGAVSVFAEASLIRSAVWSFMAPTGC